MEVLKFMPTNSKHPKLIYVYSVYAEAEVVCEQSMRMNIITADKGSEQFLKAYGSQSKESRYIQ